MHYTVDTFNSISSKKENDYSPTFDSFYEAKRFCQDRGFKKFFELHDPKNTWTTEQRYIPEKEYFKHMEITKIK